MTAVGMRRMELPKGYKILIESIPDDPHTDSWWSVLYQWRPKKFLRKAKWVVVARVRIGFSRNHRRETRLELEMIELARDRERFN